MMSIQSVQSWNPEKIQTEKNQTLSTPSLSGEEKATPLSERFGEMLEKVDQSQRAADTAMNDYASGKQNDLHGTMIAIEKADIMFHFAANIRNKALDAYREIMRMNG